MPIRQASPLALITLFLLLVTFFISAFSLQVPAVVATDNTNNGERFSAQSALERLAGILPENDRPHSVNTIENSQVRQKIVQQLSDLGLDTEIQTSMSCNNSQRSLNCSNVSNIITQLPGTDPSSTVMLIAHYDSVAAASGAADAGHAVAIILEIIELLKKQPDFKNNLVILINEGEEYGLLGAEAFMAEHPLAKSIDMVINLEARGNEGKSLLFETGKNNYGLIKLYQESAISPLSNSLTYEIYKLLPNDTDFSVFKRYGINGVNFAFQGNVNHYHTPSDNMENLSAGSVQHQGDNAYELLKSLLNTDVKSFPETDAVYTDILSSFMIVWPVYMTIPLSFFALFLLVLITWQLISSKKLNVKQLATAIPFGFGTVFLSALCCGILLFLVQALSGQTQPWLSQPFPMRLAVWVLPLLISLLLGRKYKDKLGFWGFVMAGNIVLATLSISAALYMPGLSYLPLLPLLVFTIAMSVISILGRLNNSVFVTVILLLSMLFMALLDFPILLLLEDALSFNIAPIFALVGSLVILLALPLIIFAEAIVLRQIIYSSAVLVVLGLLITSQQNAFSKTYPQPLNFEYLQQGDSASIQALTRHPLPQRIIAESGFSNEVMIRRPWSQAIYPSIEIDSVNLSEPMLEVISNERISNEQIITLRYSSEDPSDQFIIYSDDEQKIKTISFDQQGSNKQSFNVPAMNETQYFNCTGIDCNNLTFTMTVEGLETVKLHLLSYQFGLPESLGYLEQTRGNDTQQIQLGDVSVVYKQIEIPNTK